MRFTIIYSNHKFGLKPKHNNYKIEEKIKNLKINKAK